MATRAVTDTNVAAYLLLQTPSFTCEAERFWASGVRALAPAHWQAEIANAVWVASRAGRVAAEYATELLAEAERLPVITIAIPRLWQGALARSLATGVAIYDTLFVELAIQRGCPLATFDQAVLRAFPEIAVRPRDLL